LAIEKGGTKINKTGENDDDSYGLVAIRYLHKRENGGGAVIS
jgi:hypothetical protein